MDLLEHTTGVPGGRTITSVLARGGVWVSCCLLLFELSNTTRIAKAGFWLSQPVQTQVM